MGNKISKEEKQKKKEEKERKKKEKKEKKEKEKKEKEERKRKEKEEKEKKKNAKKNKNNNIHNRFINTTNIYNSNNINNVNNINNINNISNSNNINNINNINNHNLNTNSNNIKHKKQKIDSYQINKEIKADEKIEDYEQTINIKEDRCITSFTILGNNRIMLTFKGGFIKIYEIVIDENTQNIKLNEIIKIEEKEYCFNYGIELQNGNLAVCSEDSTIKIIKIKDEDDEDEEEDEENKDKKYSIIQEEELDNEPLYIVKQLTGGELVFGGWDYITMFSYIKSINKFEFIHKVQIKDRTFSLLELNPSVIVSSQCYSRKLTLYNIKTCEMESINNIESNENPNILCKYNNKNNIIFVANNKNISIVSIDKKCVLKYIELNVEVTSICPFITHINENNKKKEVFTLICGLKKKVFWKDVNYYFNLIQIGIIINPEENQKKNNHNKDNNNIVYYFLSEKEKVHFYDIKAIENLKYCKNITTKENEQKLITIGSEDRRMILWEIKNKNIKK